MSGTRQKRFAFLAVLSLIVIFVLFLLALRRDVIGYAPPAPAPKAKLILETNADPKKGAGVQPAADKAEDKINDQILQKEISDEAILSDKAAGKIPDAADSKKLKAAAGTEKTKLKKTSNHDGDDEDEDEPYDAAAGLAEIRLLAPMIVFSKSYCGYSKRIKKLLAENYQITPAPMYVELDKHKHGPELQTLLAQVTGRGLVPNVLLGPSEKSRGGADDFLDWHLEGLLEQKLNEWGGKKLVAKKIDPPSNI